MDRNSISQIRKELESCIGKRIQLKANKGRKKTIIREGIIENAYPSIFTVSFENEFNSPRMVSYSYTDILTHTVEVKIIPGNLNNVAL
ncbi:MAG TPA: Veg protein [Clostridiaceae bacterium]|nr:Veg protein [Clostridiaceae bacterium]